MGCELWSGVLGIGKIGSLRLYDLMQLMLLIMKWLSLECRGRDIKRFLFGSTLVGSRGLTSSSFSRGAAE